MLLVKHDEISERKLKASISALKENKRTQLKNTRRKDLSARQGFRLVLRSLISQRLVLITKRKKGNIILPMYLISAD